MKSSPKVMHPVYMPFSEARLRSHFGDVRRGGRCSSAADKHMLYYKKSLSNYEAYLSMSQNRAGASIAELRSPCQIEKDEKFWVAACMMSIFYSPERTDQLAELLKRAYGKTPPIPDVNSWEECIKGRLHLYFEPKLPSPLTYKAWLRDNFRQRHLIPYVLVCAAEKRALEGPTSLDAMLLHTKTGFSVIVEAKVLSDISDQITYDVMRNQIARNVDVMLERNDNLCDPLNKRNPHKTVFLLITPRIFKENSTSRLYGHKMNAYKTHPKSLAQDLQHRTGNDWKDVSRRLGWLTWEDFKEVNRDCCSWLR